MSRFIFPEWTETFKKALLPLLGGAPLFLVGLWAYGLTPEAIRIGYEPEQPVPYSHALHVGELGLDCRYCHNTVEESPHAAIPPAATCMNCHTGIHAESGKLLPIRQAYAGEKPIEWVRVHDLPDYVYFNHSAHINRNVGCESCHGRIDTMEVVRQEKALTMSWCLDCHRNPYPNLRPYEDVTKMGYDEALEKQGVDREQQGRELAGCSSEGDCVISPRSDCSTCHR